MFFYRLLRRSRRRRRRRRRFLSVMLRRGDDGTRAFVRLLQLTRTIRVQVRGRVVRTPDD